VEREWDAFLAEFAPLVLQIVHLFERDPDQIEDCFVFVCERLRRDGLRRLRAFRTEGTASFPTWLRVVVRNLCLDWRRARFGRPRLPRGIARLPAVDQEVFRCTRLRGLSEAEALHTLRAVFPFLTREHLADSLARIERTLTSRQSWSLLTRRPRFESLSTASDEPEAPDRARDPADPRPSPEARAERAESLGVLAGALDRLARPDRLLLRLRFGQDLTFEQIARLTGLASAAAVEKALEAALLKLRSDLAACGPGALSVEGRWAGAERQPSAPSEP